MRPYLFVDFWALGRQNISFRIISVIKNMSRLTQQIIQKSLRHAPRNDSLSEHIFDRHYN